MGGVPRGDVVNDPSTQGDTTRWRRGHSLPQGVVLGQPPKKLAGFEKEALKGTAEKGLGLGFGVRVRVRG